MDSPHAVPPGAPGNPSAAADSHLEHLLVPAVQEPWLRTFVRDLKDALRPERLPPLDVTSQPVRVKPIWGEYRYGRRAGTYSISIHAALIAVLLLVGTSKPVQNKIARVLPVFTPSKWWATPPENNGKPGSGGGGDRSPLPPSRGQLPPFADRQLAPPSVRTQQAELMVPPTLIGPAYTKVPQIEAPNWGDPTSTFTGPPSNGPGGPGGIGSGCCNGVGPGKGVGAGPGEAGTGLANAFTVQTGVTRPVLIYKVEPEYSEEARKARFQGTVVLYAVIDEHGIPTGIQVRRGLGLGLDEKAIEALEKWRFKPGYRNGKVVPVAVVVEVTFRLL